jgi:CDP-glycerol glycerophosphotransferase (TagB/SpsB family)
LSTAPKQILFGGYAPVHFLCFRPVYERLLRDPDVEVWLSGGYRRESDGRSWFEVEGFYDRLLPSPDRVIPFDQAYEREYDVAICAHTSGSLLPREARRTVQIFHGVSFKNFAVRDKVLQYDVICLPGPYHAQRFRDEGLLRGSGSTFLISGFPKTDRLVDPGFDRDAFLRDRDLAPGLPTILFAPTGGKNNSLETIGEQVIQTIATDGRWNLLIKPHDHPKRAIDWFERLGPLENERVRLVHDLDVIDPLRAADLLLSDASSVAVEYTLLDRPMVFIDVPKLLKNVLKRGAPLDLETHGRKIGRIARTADEVVAEISWGLENPAAQSEIRRQTAARVFSSPGRAADRVAQIVRWSAGLEPGPPAEVERLTS